METGLNMLDSNITVVDFKKLDSNIGDLINEISEIKTVLLKIAKTLHITNPTKTSIFSNVESLPDDEFLDKCDEEDLAHAKEQVKSRYINLGTELDEINKQFTEQLENIKVEHTDVIHNPTSILETVSTAISIQLK